MKWFKRCLIGVVIALFVFAGEDGYYHPGNDMREGAIIAAAIGWPITTAIVVGSWRNCERD